MDFLMGAIKPDMVVRIREKHFQFLYRMTLYLHGPKFKCSRPNVAPMDSR